MAKLEDAVAPKASEETLVGASPTKRTESDWRSWYTRET